MPVVREDMDLPGRHSPLAEVTVALAGVDCKPLYGYTIAPEALRTVLGVKNLKRGYGINEQGYWELDLVGNNYINPPGTVYRIRRKTSDGMVADTCISVPVTGGPYEVSGLDINPPSAIPTADPSNELDAVELGVGVVPLGPFDGTSILPIPGMVVSVPDVDRVCWLWAQLRMEHTVANVNVETVIAVPGSTLITEAVARGSDFVGTVGKEVTPVAWGRIAPNSPATYQAFAYTDTVGSINVITGLSTRIAVLGV